MNALSQDGGFSAILESNLLYWLSRFNPERVLTLGTMFGGKKGIELGGPSRIFTSHGPVPVYPRTKSITFVDFRKDNLWSQKKDSLLEEMSGKSSWEFTYSDGVLLDEFSSNSADFVISSHVLEHIANPIKALKRWYDILKPGGVMLIVAPDKRFTFDHRRPLTSIQHMLSDFEHETDESDNTHFREIIELHDRSLDDKNETLEELSCRILNNYNLRSAHHHTYTKESVSTLVTIIGMAVSYSYLIQPNNIVVAATKP